MSAISRERVLTRITELFFPRTDIYARSFLKGDGSMGYSPACAHSSSCYKGSGCDEWTPEAITDDVIYDHLSAKTLTPRSLTVGSYGVSATDGANWACLDVDAHARAGEDREGKLEAARSTTKMLAATLRGLHVPHYVEHSGGGYHTWVFVETSAEVAQKAGKAIVQIAKQSSPIGDVEVFPKQGSTDAFGNLLKLPLGLHYTGRKTYFVDPTTLERLPDQYGEGGLLGFQRVDVGLLEKLAAGYEEPVNRRELPMMAQQRHEGIEVGPPCVAAMLNAQLREGENRNQVLFQLTVDLRRAGMVDIDTAMLVLRPWNERQIHPLTEHEFVGTVRSAFRIARPSWGCEKGYMQPYCSADRCPIQQVRPRPEPRVEPQVKQEVKRENDDDLYNYVRKSAYRTGFRWEGRN